MSYQILRQYNELTDVIFYTEQHTDITYGRFPNGTGDFQFMLSAEPNSKKNGTTSIANREVISTIRIFPNRTSDVSNIA